MTPKTLCVLLSGVSCVAAVLGVTEERWAAWFGSTAMVDAYLALKN